MGRPSLTVRRSTRANNDDDDDHSKHFPRRYPRIGTAFQLKLDASNTCLLDRPVPRLMSLEVPYRLESEIQDNTIMTETTTTEVEATPSSWSASVATGYETNITPRREGGSLVNGRANNSNDGVAFLEYTQPFGSVYHQQQDNKDDDWIDKVVQWHAATLEANTGRRKSRFKRPRDNTLPATTSSRPHKVQILESDNDEQLLEYSAQNSMEQQAQWCLLVKLSQGKARASQRAIERDEEISQESWLNAVERQIGMQGIYTVPKSCATVTTKSMDPEQAKEVWEAVWAYGQAMEQDLKEKKTSLSSIVSFLHRACELPLPDEIYTPSQVKELDTTMWNLVDICAAARKCRAKLMDLWAQDGVDVDVLRKELQKPTPVELDEMAELNRQVRVVMEWQQRLDAVLNNPKEDDDNRNDLLALEELAREARGHGFRSKGLLSLERKVEKAYQLRDRIQLWKKSCEEDSSSKESLKFVGAMVRDIQRLKLRYPEASDLLGFYREAESWVDRANIAIRSRISLEEIRQLIEKGQAMPVDLSEYLEKLRSRVSLAEDWLESFEEIVPCPSDNKMLEWMNRMRQELEDGNHSLLHELACEGSRIPVEIDCVKLLQVELDARSWSAKAKRWIPGSESCGDDISRRGKYDDLQEHVEKAEALREKLVLTVEERRAWVLEGEKELCAIVEAADEWFEKYEPYLEGDNRRAGGRRCLPIQKLREIVQEGNDIHANLGSATSKISKILVQAEEWYEKYHPLVKRCNSRVEGSSDYRVELSELTAAVNEAASEISLDLDEAMELSGLVDRINSWFDRASVAAGGKRQRRGKKLMFTVDDLVQLIEEASGLPVDTHEDVRLLREQLSAVQAWQARASNELEGIVVGFQHLREAINETYGEPSAFSQKTSNSKEESGGEQPDVSETGECVADTDDKDATPMEVDFADEKKAADDMSHCETVSTAASEQDVNSLSHLGNGDCNVHLLIKNISKDAKHSCIVTPEGQMASQLELVWRWCMRSLKYLDTHRDIFDKRFFGAFDRFMSEGKELVTKCDHSPEMDVSGRLSSSYRAVVSDQLERLNILLSERDQFVTFCNEADLVLFSDDKRATIDKLQELVEKSNSFPCECDMVEKVKGLASAVEAWMDSARRKLDADEKLTMLEAKAIFDEGNKLGIHCSELRVLRNGLKTARTWANRVKRCKLEHGGTHVDNVKTFLEEHDDLIVRMPEELSKLRHAMRNYCICRRPYEGFMIGCDTCGEWFHGPCIGVSESRADRFGKYVCVRCSVSRVFKNSASTIAGVIRKWTSEKELRKARQSEAQKHQRKVRKETKDIEKLFEEQKSLQSQLLEIEKGPEVVGNKLNDEGCIDASTEDTVAGKHGDAALSMHDVGGKSDDVKEGELPPIDSNEGSTQPPSVDLARVENGDSIDAAQVSSCKEVKDILLGKLQKICQDIQKCESHLRALAETATLRMKQQESEDLSYGRLRTWCIRVRSLVLVPPTAEKAIESRPNRNGSLPIAMLSLASEAEQFGLLMIEDVNTVINSFKCLCWSVNSMSLLARQPSIAEIDSLVSQAKSLKLPDEKAFRMMKSMAQRAVVWQSKVSKALTPIPGETKPFNIDVLKDLAHTGDDIPLCMPLEARLLTVIDDKGVRHCLCGGPSDGRFMVSCDRCDKWFHGHCVGVKKEESDELDEWKCPSCAGMSLDVACLELSNFHYRFDVDNDDSSTDEEDSSSKAPDPDEMWPPFGLANSEKAVEALGEECTAIPEAAGEWFYSTHMIVRDPSKFRPQIKNDAGFEPSGAVSAMNATASLPGLERRSATSVSMFPMPLASVEPVGTVKFSAEQPTISSGLSVSVPSLNATSVSTENDESLDMDIDASENASKHSLHVELSQNEAKAPGDPRGFSSEPNAITTTAPSHTSANSTEVSTASALLNRTSGAKAGFSFSEDTIAKPLAYSEGDAEPSRADTILPEDAFKSDSMSAVRDVLVAPIKGQTFE